MEEEAEVADLVLRIKDAFGEKLSSYKTPKFDAFFRELHQACESDCTTSVILFQKALNRCIPMIGKEFFRVIDTVFVFRWFAQDSNSIKLFSSFVTNLVSIHPFFAHSVVNMLVENLQYNQTPWAYLEVHDLLKKIVHIIPSITPYLTNAMNDSFPHATQPLQDQQVWLENLLMICDYLPVLRNGILELVVEKLIEVDFLAGESPDSNTNPSLEREEVQTPFITSENLAKVDVLLRMLLEYLRSLYEKDSLQDTFYALLTTFERLLLCTFKSHFVQFFIYYVCSLHPNYSEIFLGMLMSNLIKASSISNADVCKSITSNYVASFVARAAFLDSSSVVWSFLLLLEWTDNYLATYEEQLYSVEKHCVFFSVAQAIFYIFCFRHEQILKESGAWFQLQNSLSKLINSTLNPLKICCIAVVHEFARIAAEYQLVYCFNILERNRKIGAFSGYIGSETTLDLLSMFPFDPIDDRLEKCALLLPKTLFVEWQASVNGSDDGLFDCSSRDAPTPPNSCAPPNGLDDSCGEHYPLEMMHKSSSFLLLNFNDSCMDDYLEI